MPLPYHIPVLLRPTVDLLVFRPGGVYVDATFGGGGHSRHILETMDAKARLISLDQDPDAAQQAKALAPDARFTFIATNFRDLKVAMLQAGVKKVDGILADLGVSSHQFDEASRGFSYRAEAPLDMRMNPDQPLSAHTVLNTYPEAQLATMFREYAEARKPYLLAKLIVQARALKPLETTLDLLNALRPALPKHNDWDMLAPLFQAIRIEVNDEMGALKEFLEAARDVLAPGGRLVILSYHSLEDRLVKHFLRFGNFEGKAEKDFYGNLLTPFEAVTRKAIAPPDDEIAQNPRARSAKLRAAAKAT